MKKRFKTLFIVLIVISVLQTVGGIVYLSFTAANDKSYTEVVCTITEVDSVPTDEEDESQNFTIESIKVEYVNADGEVVEGVLKDFPSDKFGVGTVLNGRYKDDPHSITLTRTNWFLPSLVLVIGVAYAIGAVVLYASRKNMGLYALSDMTDGTDESEEPENVEIAENDVNQSIFGD